MTRQGAFKAGLTTYCAGVLAFLLLPLFVVLPVSLTSSPRLSFPPEGWSLRWYEEILSQSYWRDAAWLSVRLGLATAVVSVLAGFAAALGMRRIGSNRMRNLTRATILTPIITPVILLAVAMYYFSLEVGIAGSFLGLLVGHTVMALPYAVLVLESGLASFDPELEKVSRSLGASNLATYRRVTLPLLMPSIGGAALFAFIMSWDEVVVALFVGGVRNRTLPVRMFEFVETQVEPTVAALSTLLILAVIAAWVLQRLIAAWIGAGRRRVAEIPN